MKIQSSFTSPRNLRVFLAILAITLYGSETFAGAFSSSTTQHNPSHYTPHARIDNAGTVRTLYNVASPRYTGAPEQAARSFIASQRAALNIANDGTTLRAERVQVYRGGSHVRFTQMYRGLRVYQGEVVVSMNSQGEVGMVVNNFQNSISLASIAPSLSSSQAISNAKGHLGAHGSPIGRPETAELMVLRGDDGTDHLSYRVTMTYEDPPGDWEVFVDAMTGAVLRVKDLFVMYADGERTQGSGSIYLPDPLSTAHEKYGAPGFINNDNADSDSLTYYRTWVPLDSITFEEGVFKLKGPYCDITDLESPADPPYYAEDSPEAFHYTRSQPGFEAVMAYYHVNAAYRRLLDLGISSESLALIRVDPHGFQGKDNSHYSPLGNWMSFGTGGVHDAQDADVIWHEYGHAIIYNLDPSWGGGESGPLGEGFGDYWAGSNSRALRRWVPTDPEYNWVFTWDGHNEYWSGRILNDLRRYPFPSGSIHSAGQIWSSALMSIREDLGRDITDQLVVNSFLYLGAGATAVDNAQAILQADRDLFAGAHLPTLTYWLGTVKNFLPQLSPGRVLVVDDDATGSTDSLASGSKGINVVYSPSAFRSSASLFMAARLPDGYQIERTPFASLDTTQLDHFGVVVLAGGINARPFNDAAKREALVAYVSRGGRVLVEGGEVGYFYRITADGEEDETFRRVILHDSAFVSDAQGASLLLSPTQCPLFNTPHAITGQIGFTSRSTFADRDIMTVSSPDPFTLSIGAWSTNPGAPGIILHEGADGNPEIVFLTFAVASIRDSSEADHLVENTLSALLLGMNATTAVSPSAPPEHPHAFALGQNYPNPFNGSTHIVFQVEKREPVSLVVYDIIGREIQVLLNETKAPGIYDVWFDASRLPSGVYLCRMTAGGLTQTRKMILVR